MSILEACIVDIWLHIKFSDFTDHKSMFFSTDCQPIFLHSRRNWSLNLNLHSPEIQQEMPFRKLQNKFIVAYWSFLETFLVISPKKGRHTAVSSSLFASSHGISKASAQPSTPAKRDSDGQRPFICCRCCDCEQMRPGPSFQVFREKKPWFTSKDGNLVWFSWIWWDLFRMGFDESWRSWFL